MDDSDAPIDENTMIDNDVLDSADDDEMGGDDSLDRCLLSVDRRVKVTKSGRVMSMSCLSIVGNRNGVVGYGIGRASNMEEAQAKSFRKAERDLLFVPRVHEESLLHNVEGKCGGTKVILHAGKSYCRHFCVFYNGIGGDGEMEMAHEDSCRIGYVDGDADGVNDRDGDGVIDGDGDGDGIGNGHGDEGGDGDGIGIGYGDGDRDGIGKGYGDADGDGDGIGNGVERWRWG